MSSAQVVQILRDALMAAFWISLPLLAVGFLAGILISMLQVLTSIQDTAFSTVPRLVIYLLTILAILPWMVNRSMTYTMDLLVHLGRYAK